MIYLWSAVVVVIAVQQFTVNTLIKRANIAAERISLLEKKINKN